MKREHILINDIVIPDGYERLEYIQSQGNQWIDTGLITSSSWTSYQFEGEMARSGSPAGAAHGTHYWGMGSSGTTWWDFGGTIVLDQWYKMKFIKQIRQKVEIYLDDVLKYTSTGSTWTNSNYNLHLFLFRLTNGSIGKWKCKWGIFTLDGIDERIYLPLIRLYDSKPGLFDFAHNVFYTNAGTGEFLYA
ncbi:MAG: hypothetical protein J5644_03735 [Bacteroidales bacterium]|nr:hypothetical protein [Bacteroidales bacterium]